MPSAIASTDRAGGVGVDTETDDEAGGDARTPHTSWPWPSKACRHHAGAELVRRLLDRFGVRRREDRCSLDVFFGTDERDSSFSQCQQR